MTVPCLCARRWAWGEWGCIEREVGNLIRAISLYSLRICSREEAHAVLALVTSDS